METRSWNYLTASFAVTKTQPFREMRIFFVWTGLQETELRSMDSSSDENGWGMFMMPEKFQQRIHGSKISASVDPDSVQNHRSEFLL